jgi:hypothetical protein
MHCINTQPIICLSLRVQVPFAATWDACQLSSHSCTGLVLVCTNAIQSHQHPACMAHGRWKDLLQEGTLQPSAAPGCSHTLQRRVRARRTSGTTDCSLFKESTEICGGHRKYNQRMFCMWVWVWRGGGEGREVTDKQGVASSGECDHAASSQAATKNCRGTARHAIHRVPPARLILNCMCTGFHS